MNLITKDYVLVVTSKSTRDGEYRICCPYCDDDKFHMYCNLSKMVYHCFKCEAKGKIATNVNVPVLDNFKEAQKAIYNYMTLDTLEKKFIHPYIGIKPKTMAEYVIRKENNMLSPKVIKSLPHSTTFGNCKDEDIEVAAYKYLRRRGITSDEIHKYCRFSLEKSGPYQETVIFPIYNELGMSDKNDGQLKSFVCRRYTDRQPKYINAPWPKEDTLFIAVDESHRINNIKPSTVVIVEGVFDALAVARAQYTGVAILGKKATTLQIQRLVDNYSQFIICLDRDAFSYSVDLMLQLRTMADISSKKSHSTIMLVENRNDVADMAKENVNRLREILDEHYTNFKKS